MKVICPECGKIKDTEEGEVYGSLKWPICWICFIFNYNMNEEEYIKLI